MFSSILVVCVGNICRSPMGEYLLKDNCYRKGMKVSISSAGIGALVGKAADPLAQEVMAEHDIDVLAHRARQLNDNLVKQNELILVMETWQKEEIEHLYPYARGRVHLLGKWDAAEIADPYKKPKPHFVEAFEKIEQSCRLWCEKLC